MDFTRYLGEIQEIRNGNAVLFWLCRQNIVGCACISSTYPLLEGV
ncbi:MAG: hypothetical protein CMIDDMOC_00063 [Sodalis sp. Fle]|nr:MAG: hypothetical protein CMIDDMOC_00063 [Sodalis sp. Fle]